MNPIVQKPMNGTGIKRLLSLLAFTLLSVIAHAQITGTVYRDYNANGQKATNDNGVAGITVTAYNTAGAAVGSATTANNGSYSIAPTGSGPFRLEFTNLPAGDFTGPFGTQSGTMVQFVASNPSSNNNLGINNPNLYCQDNPRVATPIYINGNPLGGGTSGQADVLFTYDYNASGIGGSGVTTSAAKNVQTGAIWGLAYQKASNTLFESAVIKRHAGLGGLGIGGIYKTTNANSGAPTTSDYVNVSSIGINVGIDPHIGLPANKVDGNTDPNAFGVIGKVGIGDIDLSDDGTKMYLTNLLDRKLYIINNVNPNTTPTAGDVSSFAIPNPGCSNGDYRPWGIKVYKGKVYVGVVCSAETSQNAADLKAAVYEFDGTSFTQVIAPFALNYTRGAANNGGLGEANWRPWTASMPASGASTGIYNQPLLSDIEFSPADGSMILGFSDRWGNQVGFLNQNPDGSFFEQGYSQGELLRAGANANGTWTIENNASITSNGITTTTSGANNGQGIGGGEFYYQEDPFPAHQESAQGGIATLPGSGEVLTTIMDPGGRIRTGGIAHMSNTNGQIGTQYELYESFDASTFSKANGVGDIEVMCGLAPIEIGNRVWNDTDGDGIQDAGETGRAGVTVQLYQNGNLVATKITDANGNYIFTGLAPNTNYEIRIPTAGANATALAGLTLSPADQGSNDAIDNDGTTSGSNVIKALTTGGYGENNHTYDFGFNSIRFDLALRKTVASAPTPIVIGSKVTFKVEVFNQGNVVATNTQVTDYIPAGFTFVPADNAAWTASGSNATTTIASIAAGASQSVNIVLTVNANAGTSLRNTAEISNDSGNDVDSTPDTDPNNDGTVTDDEINGGNGDQDDSDISDIAITPLMNLGNQVWIDTNNNGVKDAGEPIIAGATVKLYNAAGTTVLATTTTDANGLYIFTGLTAGDYVVGVTPGGTFVSSTGAGQEANPNTNGDNNDNGVTTAAGETRSGVVTLAVGTEPTGENPSNNPAGTADNNSNLTVDFGFYAPATLGNYVWEDKNANGVQEVGENGLAGVTVTLFDAAGASIGTTTTDALGFYQFTNLAPGTYSVGFANPAGYTPTIANAGNDDELDSDADVTTGKTQTVTLTSGQSNQTLDAGFYKPVNLGNQVWEDTNNNGVKDAGEPIIAGATVKLYNAAGTTVLATTTTDANGLYLFDNLKPGDYVVGVTPGSTFVSSTGAGQEANPNTNGDNNDNGVTTTAGETRSGVVSLAAGTEPTGENPSNNGSTIADNSSNLTVDFGFYKPARIGDKVFDDLNGDGIQDAGEPGIAGVIVKLLDGAGNPVLGPTGQPVTTVTDANGNYFFDVVPGTYIVEFVKPSGYDPSNPNAGTDPTKDSNASVTTGRTQPITLGSGQTDNTIDAGFTKPLNLGNQVWEDTNNNGVKDAGEPIIAGATVKLYNAAGTTVLATTTTDANGLYIFAGLTAGDYVVGVTPGSTFVSSTGAGQEANPNTNGDNNDNGITTTAGETRSGVVSLAAGTEPTGENPSNNPAGTADNSSNLTVDFGFYKPARIGDKVFDDLNGDGIQDAGEPGIAGVIVKLLDAAGNPVLGPTGQPVTTVTDANGNYFFDVVPGTYIVEFVKPSGYDPSNPNAGTDPTKDSNASVTTGRTQPITLGSGQTDNTIDAGFTKPLNLGNQVWEDTNNNGVKDAGEPIIAGATVKLYNAAGTTVLATTTTDANGLYIFTGLRAGDYVVGVTPGSTFVSSTGAGEEANPNTNGDNNDNGVTTTAGETRSGVVSLAAGTEPTGENPSNNPAGVSDANSNLTVDFGFYKPARIGDKVFDDLNGDGIQDAGEPGIAGVIVKLLDGAGNPVLGPTGQPVTTVTDANGNYFFDVVPGTYIVEFVKPSGYDPSNPNAGTDPTKDSNASVTTGRTQPITLGSGQTDNTIDAGFTKPLNLGNQVWEDTNNNGVKDAGEPIIAGATVKLYNAAGTTVLATTTTDANGLYIFTGLRAGDYVVGVTPGSTYVSSTGAGQEANPNTNGDNNDNGITTTAGETRSGVVSLAAGTEPTGENPSNNPAGTADNSSNLTVDFGFYKPARIGDKVFDDLNGDGIQDAGEPGIAGVIVKLLDAAGNPVLGPTGQPVTTVTDANGNYFFDVVPGTYIVEFVKPSGYDPSNPNAGTDPTKDSNASVTTGRTQPITLGSGQTDNTIDAGFTKPLNLGNQVWIDTNNNGIKDASELPIAGATVKLYNAAGTTVLATTTTDANGLYIFTGLRAGDYVVGVTPGGTYVSSTGAGQEANPNTNGDNNDNGVTTTAGETRSGVVSLAAGTEPTGENPSNNPAGTADNSSNLTVDFGFYVPASLGDKVFSDDNQDGVQDPTEPGIAGVIVKLLDGAGNPVLGANGQPVTTTTDANGNYLFANLAPGSYIVEFVKPANFTSSPQGTGTDPTKDSDANTTTGRSNAVTLNSGDAKTDVDAGFYQPLNLGNQVWLDANNNGLKDAGEAPIAGATVKLYADANNDGQPDGAAINTTTTDANGNYLFNNLKPGSYIVGVVNPLGFNSSTGAGQEANPNTNGDNNDNGVTTVAGETRSGTVALTVGGEPTGENPSNNPAGVPDANSNLTVDFGFFQPAALGNFVFADANQNGIQDAGEAGIVGVTVNLLDAGGNTVGTTTTDALGAYSFTNLAPGTYTVEFIRPNGLTFSPASQGTDPTKDSNANTSSGRSAPVTLASGENNTTIDAGLYSTPNAGLGNFVWIDSNKDGVQDAGETGVSGVTVTLFDVNGSPVATTITDATGFYSFNNLVPGTYSVGFTLPIGYTFTGKDLGGNDTKDSDADVQTGRTGNYTLTSGQFNPTVDAGIYLTPPPNNASLGNFVWYDTNTNGVQDAGEVGVQGVVVDLLDVSGNVIATTITDALGEYIFNGLAPGTYSVKFRNLPTGYSFSPSNSGTDDTKDSDASTTTGETQQVTLVTGEYNQTLDAGINKPNAALASLGDFVFNDLNGDGVQDANEPGVEGVSVTLYDGAGNAVGSTVTDVNGFYLFPNLAPGTYSVGFNNLPQGFVFTTKDAGTDDTKDSDADATTGRTPTVTLAAGQNNRDLDAGVKSNTPLAGLGNFVWNDVNANGIQEATEVGVPGVTVTLFNSAGTPISTTITDQNGAYTFVNLQPGTYSVGFSTLPANAIFTKKDIGADGTDSDADPVTGKTVAYTLVGGQYNPTVDAGIYVPGSIGNFVWEDRDGDGVQDPGEPGIAGVTVTLFDASGNSIASVVTGPNGEYVFNGLPAGTYTVGFTTPTGYIGTIGGAGGDGTKDSDAGTNGRTQPIVLGQGQVRTDIDAGFVKLAKLGDKVFTDSNANGIQDAGEPGVAGVTATLYDATTNAVVSTKVTDANGNYLFDNLTPGSYYVIFTKPAGSVITTKDAGTDDTKDSDADVATGKTGTYTLGSGASNLTVDMGIYVPASLGDKVFGDTNKDGVQDPGEPGVSGIVVKLLDGNGAIIATTTTDANGNYVFSGLMPGKPYIVEFGKPSGFDYSPQQIGTDPTKDSDANPATGRTNPIVLGSGENNTTIDAGLFNATPTPVTLIDLSVRAVDRHVYVDWSTASEINNDRFEVERVRNIGETPELIATKKGFGTTNIRQKYGVIDYEPYTGESYYRVVQFDFDGKSEVLRGNWIKVVLADITKELTLKVFPNPSNTVFNVILKGDAGEASIVMYDARGKVVYASEMDLERGVEVRTQIDVRQFQSGNYTLKVVQGESEKIQRLIISK